MTSRRPITTSSAPFALRAALVAVAVAGISFCGGSPQTPSVQTPSAPTPAPTSLPALPLPYGQATASASCRTAAPPGSTCSGLAVACPAIPNAVATLWISRPASTASNRGTIVLTTGAEGTLLDAASLTRAMIATFVADGLTVVQVGWDPPGIWGDARARSVACRYATAAKWIYDNVHVGGRSRLFAAQGTSGGAAQIAFGLAHFGLGDLLDLANLGGGPPTCPLCACDRVTAIEHLLPASLDFDLCSTPPPINRDPLLGYPATVVRFFLGDQDVNNPTVDHGKRYYDAITSAKSYTTVPNTPHVVESTQAGVDAYVASVRAALK